MVADIVMISPSASTQSEVSIMFHGPFSNLIHGCTANLYSLPGFFVNPSTAGKYNGGSVISHLER